MAETLLPAPTPETELPAQPAGQRVWSRLGSFFLRRREASIFIIAVVLIIYFRVSSANFLTSANISTLFGFIYATAIIAAGEVMLLICGEIDLSVGQVSALAPFIMYFVNQAGFPLWVGLIAGLLVSALVGLFNGVVTVWFKIPSLISTLGTQFLLNGITLTISGGFPALTPGGGSFNEIMGHGAYS